jgi:orotate phosphoribosyltransferase
VSDLRERIVDLVRREGYRYRAEPFRLASGQISHDYIDGKRAIAHGEDLQDVAEEIVLTVAQEFDAVGG